MDDYIPWCTKEDRLQLGLESEVPWAYSWIDDQSVTVPVPVL